jgi:Antibiotic biosynthesis monooxygenase
VTAITDSSAEVEALFAMLGPAHLEVLSMYTCIASFTVLPDTCELCREILHEEIVPVLRRQHGLMDLMIMQSSGEPSEFHVITFWETGDHAHDYHRDVYTPLINLLKVHMDGEANVWFFTVDTSTFHHIAAGLAASGNAARFSFPIPRRAGALSPWT